MSSSQAAAKKEGDEAPRHSGRLLLRMPAALHAELAELARREHVSLNQLITNVLAEAANGRKAGGAPRGGPSERSSRSLRIALAANFLAVAVATGLAIALLVFALRG